MSKYFRRAVRGAGITLIISVLASVVAYLTRIVLARNMSPEEYGLFFAVFTFVIFFLFFRDLGLGQALAKYIPEFKVQKKYNEIKTAITSAFLFQFGSSLIFGAFFFIFSRYLGQHYFDSPLASIILKILIVYVLFSILFILARQIFQGLQLMVLFSSVELLKNLIVLLLLLLFFYLGYTVFAPVFAYALVCPLLFLIYLPFVLRKFRFFKYKVNNFSGITKKMFTFGIPVFATSVGGKIIGYIDTLILTYFGTLTEVGVYNVVLPSALIFLFFSRALSSILFPMSSELWAKNEKKRLSQGLNLLHRYVFVTIIPIMVTAIFFAKFLISTLFGSNYSSGTPAFQILLVGVTFYVVAAVNNNLIAGIGKPKTVTAIILSAALFNVLLNLLLIPRFGILGAAFSTSISYLIMLITSTYKATGYIGSKFPIKEWLTLLFPALAFLGMLWLVEKSLHLNTWLEISISALIAGIVYFLLVSILKVVDYREIKHYLKLAR